MRCARGLDIAVKVRLRRGRVGGRTGGNTEGGDRLEGTFVDFEACGGQRGVCAGRAAARALTFGKSSHFFVDSVDERAIFGLGVLDGSHDGRRAVGGGVDDGDGGDCSIALRSFQCA